MNANSVRYVKPMDEGQSLEIKQMFGKRGPWMLNGHRLDYLQTADVMLDASTTTTSSVSLSETKSGNANMVGRALVGGALLGAPGAIVAGATGTKKTSSTSYAVETLNTDLTVRLGFSTGEVAHVIVTHKSAFQWLLSFVGRPPATDEELEKERALAEEEKTRDDLEREARSVLPLELPPDRTRLYTVLIYGAVTMGYFLLAPFHISVRIVIFFICTIVGLPLLGMS